MELLPAPMQPVDGPLPTGAGWSFEAKWDGIRICAGTARSRAWRLQTRLGNDVLSKFPELVQVGSRLGDAVLDGELVVLGENVVPDWGAVNRRRMSGQSSATALARVYPATVIVFDVLRLRGKDLLARPYWERRAVLETLDLGPGWTVLTPVSDDGPAMVEVSLAFGLEGVVAKRTGSRYYPGRRSRDWVRVRHKGVVDAVVVGWRRRNAASVTLLLAEPREGLGLVYIGRCRASDSIVELLEPLAVARPPVEVGNPPRGVQWLRPVLPVEVTAASRAPDGRLRQPVVFKRVRIDLA